MPLDSGKGNAVSALRLKELLAGAGWNAVAADPSTWPQPCEVLVVLNTWRSAAVAQEFRQSHPAGKLVGILTGTDVFPRFPTAPEVLRTLQLCDAVVAWHDESKRVLPPEIQEKTEVIYKSAPEFEHFASLPPKPFPADGEVLVLVSGHLREIKDPFRAAAALEQLPADSRIRVHHFGAALSAGMEQQAREWMNRCPRYCWHGQVERPAMVAATVAAHASINSSLAEGGANAVIESICAGVPVLASRIPGNTGLLGSSWPGLFAAGDASGLARLLRRMETEAAFYEHLSAEVRKLGARFTTAAERRGWLGLLERLF